MSDLVERLRSSYDNYGNLNISFNLLNEAADRIEELEQDNEKLRAVVDAAKPFAVRDAGDGERLYDALAALEE